MAERPVELRLDDAGKRKPEIEKPPPSPDEGLQNERLALASALVNDISNLHFGPEVGVGPASANERRQADDSAMRAISIDMAYAACRQLLDRSPIRRAG